MVRKREVGRGTSASSQVRAVPLLNRPIDRRKLAQAVLALIVAEQQREKKPRQEADHE